MLAHARRRQIGLTVIRVWRFPNFDDAYNFELWAKRSLKNYRKLLTLPCWIKFAA